MCGIALIFWNLQGTYFRHQQHSITYIIISTAIQPKLCTEISENYSRRVYTTWLTSSSKLFIKYRDSIFFDAFRDSHSSSRLGNIITKCACCHPQAPDAVEIIIKIITFFPIFNFCCVDFSTKGSTTAKAFAASHRY